MKNAETGKETRKIIRIRGGDAVADSHQNRRHIET
jgi:hypothetical protein